MRHEYSIALESIWLALLMWWFFYYVRPDYAAWQQMGDRQDEAYLNPADTGHRDSQGKA